jgi:hypothetical protein
MKAILIEGKKTKTDGGADSGRMGVAQESIKITNQNNNAEQLE